MNRNIPTGVGRSGMRSISSSCGTEHPHGRGEKDAAFLWLGRALGTSPRAWGEERLQKLLMVCCRNIPTGVGRSQDRPSSCRRTSEHPHGRGEKDAASASSVRFIGTSPRAWGEETESNMKLPKKRNIPTGVGRRVHPPRRGPRRSEHPHGRGEKVMNGKEILALFGTSPRAWGEEEIGDTPSGIRRNIPTGVGRRLPRSTLR